MQHWCDTPGRTRSLKAMVFALLCVVGLCVHAANAWADDGADAQPASDAAAAASLPVANEAAPDDGGAACEAPAVFDAPAKDSAFATSDVSQIAEAPAAADASETIGEAAAPDVPVADDAAQAAEATQTTDSAAPPATAPDVVEEADVIPLGPAALVQDEPAAAADASAVTAAVPEGATGADSKDAGAAENPAQPSDTAAAQSVAAPSGETEADAGTSTNATASPARAQAGALPARYDARSDGLVSSVRLQDPWGACWAFGSLAAMEANLVKQGLATAGDQLSPRHLIYFAGTPVGSDAGTQAGEGQHPSEDLVSLYGENAVFELGGHALEVASAISSGAGVVFEAAYPYQNDEGFLDPTGKNYDTEGTWSLDEQARYTSVFTLKNMLRFPNPGTFAETGNLGTFALNYYALDAVKQAILDYGAVSASYNSYRNNIGYADHYNEVHYTYFTAESMRIDHDVCIVGWDDDYPRENFPTGTLGIVPEGNGAWIVKNSWGSLSEDFPNRNAWGDAGYFYLSYFDRSAQGFTAWEMMPASGAASTDTQNGSAASGATTTGVSGALVEQASSIVHQYDYMGQRSNAETRVVSYSPTAAANVFSVSVPEAVHAVSVNTYVPDTQVTIALYRLPAKGAIDNPAAGTLVATKQLTLAWGGYHRISLDDAYPFDAGERFAVVVSCVETDEQGNRVPVVSIEAGNNAASMARFGLTHYDTVVCNPGESFVLVDLDGNPDTPPVWTDASIFGAILQAEARDSAYYGNANIKVFARTRVVAAPDTTQDNTTESDSPGAQPGTNAQDVPATTPQTPHNATPEPAAPVFRAARVMAAGGGSVPVVAAVYVAAPTPVPNAAPAHAPAQTADGCAVYLLVAVCVASGAMLVRLRRCA